MISFNVLMVILITHFIGDFLLQSSWMAQNKSVANIPLITHIFVYGLVLLIPSLWLFSDITQVFQFVLVNMGLHFVTDFISSRISSRLYKANKIHWFFVVVGLDQLIHYYCLFKTYLMFNV